MIPTRMSTSDQGFRPPRTMTPDQIADHLARLVWEHFSDFIAEGDAEVLLGDIGLVNEEGLPDDSVAEELLIFFMWAHTRGLQLAFVGRAPDDRVRSALDAFHAAVFEDMQLHGTPRAELPLFEQRVSARYAQYHEAAARSDVHLGTSVGEALTGDGEGTTELGYAMSRRAIAVTDPLRDFLEEVELVEGDGSGAA